MFGMDGGLAGREWPALVVTRSWRRRSNGRRPMTEHTGELTPSVPPTRRRGQTEWVFPSPNVAGRGSRPLRCGKLFEIQDSSALDRVLPGWSTTADWFLPLPDIPRGGALTTNANAGRAAAEAEVPPGETP